MHPGFRFDDARAVIDYLDDLGVSHLYLSPILQAARGSTHGYDVVDPTRVNQELGGEDGHARLTAAARAHGLAQLLDVVPNHMAISGRDNAWWWDVLENGPSSVYASYFDVDWDSPVRKLRNVVLLPILGDHYGRELEAGRLRVQREGGGFVVGYYDRTAPLDPRTVDGMLAAAGSLLVDEADEADGADGGRGVGTTRAERTGAELASIATALAHLPVSTDTAADAVAERHRDKEILRQRLAELCHDCRHVAAAVDRAVDRLNDDAEALDALLEGQNYRLAWWRTAGEELDYRRFFDITDLAAIRAEDPEVFADSHRLVLAWLADGTIDGVRVDHIDGLRDPGAYLDRLQAAVPGSWVVVEKILEGDEDLPVAWPVAGTSGYDWLNRVGGLLTEPGGAAEVVEAYRAFTGTDQRYEGIVDECKAAVLDGPLATDVTRLVARLGAICDRHRRYRDYTRRDLRRALVEVLASFPVYRTYVRAGSPPTDTDVAVIDGAIQTAGLRQPEIDDELLDLLRNLLLGRVAGRDEAELTARVQQLSGPVMAKAVEDTAFYRYLPLTWLNEVGGDPGRPGVSLDAFHRANASAQARHPDTLLATSTHDTKRSEDVRARLSVLAELPTEWEQAVGHWRAHNRRHRSGPPPGPNTEWLAYQSLVGAWPIDADRMAAYLAKATREAKVHTSWTDPDPVYDQALQQWIHECLDDEELVASIETLVARLRRPGWAVALAQKLATLTAPGVADLYQGSECWDLSLVDPDNRRPVDYARRRRLLARVATSTAVEEWAREQGAGATKMAVVRAALAVRSEHREWFGPGDAGRYEPLIARGEGAAHAVARCRGGGAVTVLTRWPAVLERDGGWRDTALPLAPGRWLDRMGGGTCAGEVPIGSLLAGLPVALLVAQGEPSGD